MKSPRARCYHGGVKQTFVTGFLAAAFLLAACLPLAAADAPAPGAPSATPSPTVPAAPTQYALGDQVLSISAGPLFPLFFLPWRATDPWTHLTVGGTGSFSWAAYVTGNIRVGVEVGGMFAFSPNMNTLLELPILAKGQYVFTPYPFEVPVGLGVGMNIVKYQDNLTIDLLLKPTASMLWVYDSKWSFGLNVDWWWDMQFASSAGDSRIGNFLATTLCALYHY